MTSPNHYAIEPPAGFRSREAALFVAQLDDQSRRLTADTLALTPAALEWQPAPGQNTMGMLLAHIAYWEVFWTRMVLEDRPMPLRMLDRKPVEPWNAARSFMVSATSCAARASATCPRFTTDS